jgi:cobalt/nickel transport protein
VLIPLTYFLLPKRFKGVGTAFMAAAIIAPLGLIAPGFAYGEGSTEDVQAAFGYIPKGLHDLSTIFSAPFSGYNLPFLSDSNALWQTAIGYEISGIIGMLLLGLAVFGVTYLVRRREPEDEIEEEPPIRIGPAPPQKRTGT